MPPAALPVWNRGSEACHLQHHSVRKFKSPGLNISCAVAVRAIPKHCCKASSATRASSTLDTCLTRMLRRNMTRGSYAIANANATDVEASLVKREVERSSTSGRAPPPVGYAALFGVALLWGSYTPAIRYLFLSENPPSPAVLNALQACLSAIFLATSGVAASIAHSENLPHPEMSNPLGAEASALASLAIEDNIAQRRAPGSAIEHACAEALNWRSSSLIVAGAELGLWMCLAFGLEILGVELISATKAAFLNQATVLITPLLVHLSGEHVKRNEWGACGLGLAGSILVAADSLGGAAHAAGLHGAAPEQENALGYLYVVLSALFFAMSTVRMGRYSTQFPALSLASGSTFSLATLSILWVMASVYGTPNGVSSTSEVLYSLFTNPTCLAVLVWVGIGPGALAAFLQATGQQSVPAAQAQVIYATTPLFATAFAMISLDASDEKMGTIAWAGAALMLGASLVASVGGHSDSSTAGTKEDTF